MFWFEQIKKVLSHFYNQQKNSWWEKVKKKGQRNFEFYQIGNKIGLSLHDFSAGWDYFVAFPSFILRRKLYFTENILRTLHIMFTVKWNTSIWDCTEECGTCCRALCCPSRVQKIVADHIRSMAPQIDLFNKRRLCIKCPCVNC